MKPNFLSQLFFLIFINLLIKPFYIFGIDLQVQNRVGQAAYGLYFALFNFSFLFQILSDWGLQQYNNRQVAQFPDWLPQRFTQLLVLKVVLSFGMFAAGAATGWLLDFRAEEYTGLLWLLLNQIFLTFILFLRSNVSGLQQYRWDSFLSVLDKIILIILCLIALYTPIFGELTIFLFILLQTASLLFTALASFLVLMICPKPRLERRWSLDLSLLRQTTPYALVVLLMTLYARVDAVMLVELLPEGSPEAGIYASGYRLLDVVTIFCFLFANLLLPMFARLLPDPNELRSLLELSFRWMLALTVSASLLLIVFAHPLAQALYRDYTPHLGSVLQILMLSFNAIGFIYIFGTLLTAAGRLYAMNWLFVGAIVLNFGLNYWAIPRWGAVGAAWVSLLTQSVVAIGEMLLVMRFLRWSFAPRLLASGALWLAGGTAIALGASYLPLDWRVSLAIAAVGLAAWAFLSRWLDVRGLREVVRR